MHQLRNEYVINNNNQNSISVCDLLVVAWTGVYLVGVGGAEGGVSVTPLLHVALTHLFTAHTPIATQLQHFFKVLTSLEKIMFTIYFS